MLPGFKTSMRIFADIPYYNAMMIRKLKALLSYDIIAYRKFHDNIGEYYD